MLNLQTGKRSSKGWVRVFGRSLQRARAGGRSSLGSHCQGGKVSLWNWSWWRNFSFVAPDLLQKEKNFQLAGNSECKSGLKEFFRKLVDGPPHLTFEDLEVQKAEGSCLWHKWNWSVPLNVFSGSCAPNHAGCRERMSWGADTAYSCFSFLAWWLWWAGLGCWTSLWHWKPVRVRVSSQWCQRSLASQKCQPFTLLLSDPS